MNDGDDKLKVGSGESISMTSSFRGDTGTGRHRTLDRQDTIDGWSVVSNSYLTDVKSIGTIKFQGVKNTFRDPRARYVVVDDNADLRSILEVLTKGWKLGMPKLVVNICGGDEKVELNNHLKEIIRSSLLHAARNIDAWVLSNGTNDGVMKFLGRSLRDLAVSSGRNRKNKKTFPIGVVDLNYIEHGGLFRETAPDTQGNIYYDISDRDTVEGDRPHLNPYHPFFILVDTNHESSRSKCNEFRCILMDEISKLTISGSTTTIPVVSLMIGGGAESIRTAHRLLVNRSPIVILAGTGGAADILTFAYRFVNTDSSPENEVKLKSGLNSLLSSLCGPEDRIELLGKVLEIIRRKVNVAIFHLHQGSAHPSLPSSFLHYDIVEAIIASLPKGGRKNQLHLAVVWNIGELVKRYFKEKRSRQDMDIYRSFEFALQNDLTDIIDLFLQQGDQLQGFLTTDKLSKLYLTIDEDSLLKELHDAKQIQLGGMSPLKVTGHIIEKLTKSGYQPLYLRHDELTFDNPIRELFIWAVLQMRIRTAKLFWVEDRAPLGGAILACKLMKAMSELEQDPQQIEEMRSHASEYEDWAVQILDQYYKEDRRKTSLAIVRELEDWGRVSCLGLAAAGRMKKIISHQAVQNLLDEMWSGRIKSNSELKHVICLIFPPASTCLLYYRPPIGVQGVAIKHFKRRKSKPLTPPPPEPSSSSSRAWNMMSRRLIGGPRDNYKPNDPETEEDLSRVKRLRYFLTAPFIIFRYDIISYLLFCALFTYMLLYEFGAEPSHVEYFLMFWVLTLAMEEVRQLFEDDSPRIRKKLLHWLQGYWNIVDLVSISMYGIGTGLRFHESTLDAARVILALDLVVFLLRSLHIFSSNRHLGPKLIMIFRMFVDLVIFVCILVVFLLAYGISVEIILYPNTPKPFTVLLTILQRAYFQIYGELFLDDSEGADFTCTFNRTEQAAGVMPCPENTWFGMVALAFYLFLSNILLLNLLIAMLNFTFQAIQDNCDILWKFQRLSLLREYYNRPPLPPPFIILFQIPAFICYVMRKTVGRCCCGFCHFYCLQRRFFRRKLDEDINEEISTWESVQGGDFVNKKRSKSLDQKDVLKMTNDRFDKLSEEFKQLQNSNKNLHDQLLKLEDRLKATTKGSD